MRKPIGSTPAVKRYRAFRKALIDEGWTVTRFAEELSVSRYHLVRSFREPERASQRVHSAIDSLIAKHRAA